MKESQIPGRQGDSFKVLVTGGAGYIGSHAALAFLAKGWSVLVVDDLSTGSRDRIPPDADFIECDCADPSVADLIRDRGIDAAVHFAARVKVDESVADPLGYYAANICAARAFFQSAHRAGLGAMVFSSTAAVYGETGDSPVREDAPTRPESPYGRSKLAAEWILADLCAATTMRHVTLRYFNVAGADPEGRSGPGAGSQHLMKVAAEAAIGQRAGMQIHGSDYPTPDGTCVRDYIHVTDLAEAHVKAVEYLLRGGESLTANCGYSRGSSVRDVIAEALLLADRPFAVTEGPRRAGDTISVVADASLLKSKLDWVPRHQDLSEMLRHGVAWERQRGVGADVTSRA